MKAVILAGGRGTRLAPYTTVLPKPLMPIGDFPILEIILRQLRSHQITEIVLCVGYLGTLLEAYFGDGSRFGLKISYSYETEPLGTAGPIGLVPSLNETFLAMNGDLLTTIDFTDMLKFHRNHGRSATVGLTAKKVHIDLGVISTKPTGCIDKYTEKPTLEYQVSMGIYVFEPSVLALIRKSERLDLPDLIRKLVDDGKEPMGYNSNCKWLDIGRVADYATAAETFEQDKQLYLPPS